MSAGAEDDRSGSPSPPAQVAFNMPESLNRLPGKMASIMPCTVVMPPRRDSKRASVLCGSRSRGVRLAALQGDAPPSDRGCADRLSASRAGRTGPAEPGDPGAELPRDLSSSIKNSWNSSTIKGRARCSNPAAWRPRRDRPSIDTRRYVEFAALSSARAAGSGRTAFASETPRVRQRQARIRLELDPFLEVDEIEFDLAGAVEHGELRDEHVQ